MDFAGKVILLVGGLDDLASSIALRLIKDGASLVFAGADPERGQALVEQAEALGGQVAFANTDPNSEMDAQSMVADAVMTFGSIDGMVAFSGASANDAADDIDADEHAISRAHDRAYQCAELRADGRADRGAHGPTAAAGNRHA